MPVNRKGQSFAAGAATLMAAALIVKVIGMLFKIPLTRMLGGEGMGYYMTAYSIFNPICALCVAGFPVAVSRLTAASLANHRREEPRRILTVALLLFLPMGLLCSAGIYLAAPFFVRIVGNEAALGAVRAIAPAVFFCCISAVFRGYYEGGRNMVPTAVSQVVEASVKLGAGILCAMHCLETELGHFTAGEPVCGVTVSSLEEAQMVIAPYAAAAAIIGVTVSTLAGCLALALAYFGEPHTGSDRIGAAGMIHYSKNLLVTALPVCAGALVVNLSSFVDLMSVINRLNYAVSLGWEALCRSHPQAGLERMEAERVGNFLFGSYSGLAMTIFHLVPAITASLGVCALPLIASLAARGSRAQLRRTVESVLRITVIVALPLGLGMSCMAGQILQLLFSSNPEEVSVAAVLLRPLGGAAVFVAVSGCINSMLQALGYVLVPVRLMLCGAAVKFGINWALIARPSINILGAPWGTLCCYLTMTLLGCAALERASGGQINLAAIFAKPLAASLLCCAAAVGCCRLLASWPQWAATLAAVGAAGAVYLIAVLLMGALREEDMELLPRRTKIRKDR